jgi:O-antigen/teichoic acid export membrane protein
MIVGSALAAHDRQRYWAYAGVGAAILNPALNVLAIPYTQDAFGNGGIGAAAVTAATEIYLFAAGQYLLSRGVLDLATLVSALKCMVAGLAMGVVVWLARDLSILLLIPLGAVVYGGVALSLGVVSLHDVQRVRGYLTQRRATANAFA